MEGDKENRIILTPKSSKQSESKARNDPNECGVCSEEFDEGIRCPRILNCFHDLCSHCLYQLIKNERKLCPFCRTPFEAQSAADVKVNQGMLELLRFISEMKIGGSPKLQQQEHPREAISEFKKKSSDACEDLLIKCLGLQSRIEKELTDTEFVRKSLSTEVTRLENVVVPKINNMISRSKRRMQEMEGIRRNLQSSLTEVKTKHTLLQDMMETFGTSHTLKEVARTVILAEDLHTSIDSWFSSKNLPLNKNEESREASNKELQETKEKVGVLTEVVNFEEDKKSAMTLTNTTSFVHFRGLSRQISGLSLRNLDDSVRTLLDQGKLFALQEHKGNWRSAKISLSKGKLHIHHLTDSRPVFNYRYVKYEEVLTLQTAVPIRAFLDFGASKSKFGRVYIDLRSANNRATHFSLLCSGEKGPSYSNTEILEAWPIGNDFQSIRVGYGKSSDCSLEEVLSSPEALEFKSKEEPWVAGTLEGACGSSGCGASQFIIRARDNPSLKCPSAFGKVVDGLNIIEAAIYYHSKEDPVQVKDCGIVLPYCYE